MHLTRLLSGYYLNRIKMVKFQDSILKKKIYHERVDAISQVVRLALLNSVNFNRLRFNRKKINKLLSIILKYQNLKKIIIKKLKGLFFGVRQVMENN